MKRMPAEARRAQILEAAHAVILQKGLAEASTRDVTRRLGVGSGLLHHYFKTWNSLRTEVVRVFITKDIKELDQVLAAAPPGQLVPVLVRWMVQDPEFRHWRLWLDAVEEARRDPGLAEVVEVGYLRWHQTLMQVIERSVTTGHGTCHTPRDAAWRLCVLIDGLVGLLAFERTPLTADAVEDLLQMQFAMELSLVR